MDGLGGVEGLPPANSVHVQTRLAAHGPPIRALEGMAKAISTTWNNGQGHKVIIVSSGPMTNIALFVSVYPDLLDGIGSCAILVRFPEFISPPFKRNSSSWAVESA